MKNVKNIIRNIISHPNFNKICGIIFAFFLLFLIPITALKYGASGDGLLGYFGAVIGGSIGALVAGWGIITTIKENRRQMISPNLIFREVNTFPEGTAVNSYPILRSGEEIVFKTIRIVNIGVGAALDCKMKGTNTIASSISDIIEKDMEKYVQIICFIKKLDNSHNKEWTQEEIKDYAIQSERIPVIFEYKNVLGEVHSYELIVNLQCSITYSNGNIDDPKCSPVLNLKSWKALR